MTVSILELRGKHALAHIKALNRDQPTAIDTGLDRSSFWKVAAIALAGLIQNERQNVPSSKRRQAANLACLIIAEHAQELANGDQVDLLVDSGGNLDLVHHHAEDQPTTRIPLGSPMDALSTRDSSD